MIKICLCLILILLSFNNYAEEVSGCNLKGVGSFKDCLTEFTKAIKNLGNPVRPNCLPTPNPPKQIYKPALVAEFYENAAQCDEFIKKDGSYGEFGKVISEYMKEEGKDSLFLKADVYGLNEACPKWSKLAAEEKAHTIVWVNAAIAKVESTCMAEGPKGTVNPHGISVGLLHLNEKLSDREWRGPNCKVKNIREFRNNLRCGMDILKDLLKGKNGLYKGDGKIWGEKANSHWKHLRKPDGGDIARLISLNPLCKN